MSEPEASLARRSHDDMQALIDSLPVIVSYVDNDLRFRRINKTYEEYLASRPPGLSAST